jgi:sigma-E factor negative regulatory protein RseA
MHDDLKQKISQFLDNELDQEESLGILKKIQIEPELLSKMIRYEAISHVLKTDVFLYPSSDFSAKVNKELKNEPTHLLPKNHIFGIQRFPRQSTIIALAASIAAVAIISFQSNNFAGNDLKKPQPLQLAKQQIPEKLAPVIAGLPEKDQLPANARFNDYLQAHNSSIYTSGEADFRPFATVSVHSRD